MSLGVVAVGQRPALDVRRARRAAAALLGAVALLAGVPAAASTASHAIERGTTWLSPGRGSPAAGGPSIPPPGSEPQRVVVQARAGHAEAAAAWASGHGASIGRQ